MPDDINSLQDKIAAANRVIALQETHIVELTQHLDVAKEAMQEFVDRVEKGEVRSHRTYSKFKTILMIMNKK
mgnify:CR=1 FL=1